MVVKPKIISSICCNLIISGESSGEETVRHMAHLEYYIRRGIIANPDGSMLSVSLVDSNVDSQSEQHKHAQNI